MALPRDSPGINDVEEGTSKSSRKLRGEAEQIYDELFKTPEVSSHVCKRDLKKTKRDEQKKKKERQESEECDERAER